MATSLGLCTLVAEDDILVSSWSLLVFFCGLTPLGSRASCSNVSPTTFCQSFIWAHYRFWHCASFSLHVGDVNSTGSWTQTCSKLFSVIYDSCNYSRVICDAWSCLFLKMLHHKSSYHALPLPASGRTRYHGVLRELVHPVVCEGGWHLSFDQPPDKPAPHQRSAVLGPVAHHLHCQPAQRHPAQVRRAVGLLLLSLLHLRKAKTISGWIYIFNSVLSAWTLCCRHLPKLPRLLESEDVNMRIAAGETIALLFELARDMDAVSWNHVSFNIPDLIIPVIHCTFGTKLLLLDAFFKMVFECSVSFCVASGVWIPRLGWTVWQTERVGHGL